MGRILRKFKFSIGKKNKLIFEMGLAVLLIILFIGALNSITATYKTPILDTKTLWEHANTTLISFEFRNTTDPSTSYAVKTYTLADVASFYDGYLYISIPYPNGYEVLRTIHIFNLNGMTVGDLIEYGVNRIYIYMEPINSTSITFGSGYHVSPLYLLIDNTGDTTWGPINNGGDEVLLNLIDEQASTNDPVDVKWKALFPDNGTINKEVGVDLGVLAIKAAGKTDKYISIHRFMGDVKGLEGLKLKLEIYAVSEKPVFKALTEPIYSIFAALYSLLLAVARRIKEYVVSAFSGFSASVFFTGLIGDPVVALVVTMAVVTVVFLVMKPRR